MLRTQSVPQHLEKVAQVVCLYKNKYLALVDGVGCAFCLFGHLGGHVAGTVLWMRFFPPGCGNATPLSNGLATTATEAVRASLGRSRADQ